MDRILNPRLLFINGRCEKKNLGDVTSVRRIWGQMAPRTKSSGSISKPDYLLGSQQWHTSLRSQHFLARCQSERHEMAEVLTSCPAAVEGVWIPYEATTGESVASLAAVCNPSATRGSHTICSLVLLQLPLSLCTHFRLHHNTPCSYPNSTAKPFLKDHINFPATQGIRQILCSA
jgi:hypothetical protein